MPLLNHEDETQILVKELGSVDLFLAIFVLQQGAKKEGHIE